MIEGISAITLGTHDMARAVRFYRVLGFELLYGGEAAAFTSFRAGSGYLNLTAQPENKRWSWWGRVIFYVADVDNGYANMAFPSVNEALRANDERLTATEIADLARRFGDATRALATARTALGGAR